MKPAASLGSGCFDARNQYIDWQEFYLWARSILEVEERIPDWLAEILNDRCSGISRNRKSTHTQSSQDQASCLSAWKIGLMIMFSASPSRKAGSTQLRITQ